MVSKDSPAKLAKYRRRRDFTKTAEPEGARGDRTGRRPRFVVQIHDASTLHFDFRLEVDGVLKSWAVPKGPSLDPHDKRLAMPTEDHPLEYREFEGVIAEGEYGAGTVIIWDEGTYRNLTTDRRGHELALADALDKGHASFRLDGSKLHGGFALTRTHLGDDREAWLLVKHDDRRASAHGTPDPRRARSARSGRTLKQLAALATGDSP
ncbi:DNA polymerase ligase N-terminal domain-containing protein [Streptomyces sp. FH025]|uniref:DNA polymerase ligase N-terminal domain-containing protein n=1 Tax=Streptomyces sp. FH025 TaxID=2815937 RepID=UPI001A9EA1FD|nr:DNA polymerase ligase N-terminal domain-containing protein [Streptomyces sp. FH025]MBO1413459.1 3'-phosphoesterase [Streptomyces sp. FH025]